ncbi:MAG: DEAD/DEAH box helicase [bacterium]|nr:DEAD/DEAH box helicase [bacterium]
MENRPESGFFVDKSSYLWYDRKVMSQDFGRHFILLMRTRHFDKNSFRKHSNFGVPKRRSGFAKKISIDRFINKNVVAQKIEVFVPVHQFQDFNINQRLKTNILAKGFKTPTLIQDKIIDYVLEGLDVVGIANTGTGKTGAFLIPLIQKVFLNPEEKVLIVVPTRELAVQINQEFKGFSKGINAYSVCCVGGASIGRQISELKNYRCHFIIGTPGRLKDLIQRRVINLSEFSTIVLDEADRMLDMGFIEDVRYIMSLMSKKRQALCFSATLPREIAVLVDEFLNNPVTVFAKTGETPENIYQDIIRVSGSEKIGALCNLLAKDEFRKVLIFGRTKYGVERLSKNLIRYGFKADSIHGDKNYASRLRSLESFKADGINILVATDVAARGLDIPDVSHVINYDVPSTYDDYVHRIGRTGRMDKKGVALTFVE